MFLEFTQNGVKKILKTPRGSHFSEVKITNRKKAVCVTVYKKHSKERKATSLKQLGESLLLDKIGLLEYLSKKVKVKQRASTSRVSVKLFKDAGSIVKIQTDLF